MLEILRHAAGQDEIPITSAAGFAVVGRGSLAASGQGSGQGRGPGRMRAVDPDLVERESFLLASALRQIVEGLPEGGAPAVGPPVRSMSVVAGGFGARNAVIKAAGVDWSEGV
jgi:hypothetical protein